ncbi:MAG: molybdopterin-binding protein, partial [Selenomonas sp.]|nr:molybdopterin-binding protein [Selenomonas sp.]
MKEIRTQDAVGQVLCHDVTQIIRGAVKGPRFRKGHIIREEDVPVLLSLGKDHVFVWENDDTVLHEDEAAEILRQLCQNEYMTASAPKEGKIELTATVDGVFQVDASRFDAVNALDDITIATLPQNMPVKAGQKLAGMRVIPLV